MSSTAWRRSVPGRRMSARRWSTSVCAAASTRETTGRTLPRSPTGPGRTSSLRVLVLNAGSSSLKLSLVDDDDRVLADREFEVAEGRLDETQLGTAIRDMEGIEAIGHRVVHGGPRYRASVRIDADGVRSVDTTMGFTPLEGLVMATRSGTVDPGALLYLQRHAAVSESELNEALDRKGGLMALAGTADMREILKRIADGDERAELAFDVYIHRLRALIAGMAAAMNGLDVLVFTGGVGENASPVRGAAVAGLRFLGVEIGPTLEASLSGDC